MSEEKYESKLTREPEVFELTAPLTREDTDKLQAGDRVYLSGIIYTARDAAHKRFVDLIEKGEKLPFEVEGSVMYYVGPAPTPEGQVIGSAGPTTSYRMDPYAPELIKLGQMGMIGKGKRDDNVIEHMKKYGTVYFAAVGGAGALLAKSIKEAEIICYEDLGAEAVRRLRVERMPLIVAIDNKGNNLYKEGPAKFLAENE